MTIEWSPHAQGLFYGILSEIREERSAEDALRWHDRIVDATLPLASFPLIGTLVPTDAFESIPPNADRLRQIICRPYRIVYEPVDDEIHILSIRHSRMLVAECDATWN